MTPGEFRRHLAAEQDRAARAGRIWPRQRVVDLALSGAEEMEARVFAYYENARALQRGEPLKTLQTFPLSAHWWHG